MYMLFGLIGGHRFYLGRAGSGIIMLALTVGLFFTWKPLLLIMVVWWFLDGFRLDGWLRQKRADLRKELQASLTR
jgi:TM2 domain-containing membrane protein YozV